MAKLAQHWRTQASVWVKKEKESQLLQHENKKNGGGGYSILKMTPSVAKQDYSNRNKYSPIELLYLDMIVVGLC